MNGLELSRAFYEQYGAPMLHEQFPDQEGSIAVGLIGSGSECLGFDDEVSRDHDFEPGFCLLLPDEGTTPEQILTSGEVSRFFSSDKQEKSIIVNLSLPKFDVNSNMDLIPKLKSLGITDIFDGTTADFSPILTEDDGGWVDEVKHATRVAIDEKGVTAAAFTLIARCGAGMPMEDEIDFTLDRPFLFYIESRDGLPLFTGIVNKP